MCGSYGGYAALGMSAASTVVGAMGEYRKQEQQNLMYGYQAKVAEINAQTSEIEAQYALSAGEKKVADHYVAGEQLKGQQRTAMAGSGAVVDVGSYEDIMLDTAEGIEADAQVIMHEAELNAWRARVQASGYRQQAGMYEAAKSDPFSAAAGTAMTGAAQTGLTYYQLFK